MYGRVLKVLGNLNFQVYGNDGRTRICKVCGAMRKRIWIATGDLVILSLREFEVSKMVKKEDRVKMTERGDIIYKFDQSLIGKAKKLDGINPNLFLQLETADGKQLAGMTDKAMEDTIDDMFGFDEDAEEDGEKKEGSSEESGDEKPGAAPKKGKAKESKHAAAGGVDDDAFDIDDI